MKIYAENNKYGHEGLDCEELINKANENLIQPTNEINNNFTGPKKMKMKIQLISLNQNLQLVFLK